MAISGKGSPLIKARESINAAVRASFSDIANSVGSWYFEGASAVVSVGAATPCREQDDPMHASTTRENWVSLSLAESKDEKLQEFKASLRTNITSVVNRERGVFDAEQISRPMGPEAFSIADREAGDDTSDEIFAFDSQTLQLRTRFGRGTFNDVQGLAVGGEELYVSDSMNDCIKIFSFAGELRRTLRGEWWRPSNPLCAGPALHDRGLLRRAA